MKNTVANVKYLGVMVRIMSSLYSRDSQVALVVKNPLASAGDARDMGLIPGSGKSSGIASGTPFSILAWKIP